MDKTIEQQLRAEGGRMNAEQRGRELPEMPTPAIVHVNEPRHFYTAKQMREYARQAIARTLTRPAPTEAEVEACVWTLADFDSSDVWETACGEAWQFISGSPEDNNVRFCHGCGKPVRPSRPATGDNL